MEKYEAKKIEKKYYQIWEDRGYFELDSNKNISCGKNFSLMMPPPNITGALHIGHALTYTLQDIIVRYKRMDGYRILWQSGLDHAGIATQNIVERELKKRNIKKEDIGREEFIKEIWKWKEEKSQIIISQLKRLGISPNWSRLRFTMDEGLKKAVKKAFVLWYKKGLIVQDNYMVNWCIHDGAISDIEVEYEESISKLYYIKYKLKDENRFIVVATSRPETYFGDVALMVNPNDPRYKNLINKKALLPLVNREIEIIEDNYVDMDFGSGCLKITPAHDANDYEIGKKHNLDSIIIFDEKGRLNSHCGKFSGLDRLEAREKIVEELSKNGFIEKIENYKNKIGKCYRCGEIIEPYISKQWFVKKDIANSSIKKVNEGGIRFYPSHWINNYNAWMNDLRPWCISRQLWWGHRIPVFYCNECGVKKASIKESENCEICKKQMEQDEDVLDTWFSSGLWAFSTLGWGQNDKKDLSDFYPNSLLITSFDILFFWVARMIFSSESIMGELPFRDVYLHALICDENGKKMSKSKGNVVDPLNLIDKYSSDILRFSLSYACIQGRDIRLGEKNIEIGRALNTKILNALNFLLMYKEKQKGDFKNEVNTPIGKYIYSRFKLSVKEVREALNNYRFNDASSIIYKFLFNEFCDWGIEFVKVKKDAVFEMGFIFKESMKLLHPFMPFLSEYVYQKIANMDLENNTSIMIEKFPIDDGKYEFIEEFEILKDVITSIRRAKVGIGKANKEIEFCYVKINKNIDLNLITQFSSLAKTKEIKITKEKMQDCIFDIGEYCEVFIPKNDIDLSKILDELAFKKCKIQKEIDKVKAILDNKNFIKNAPKNVVELNENILKNAIEKMQKIDEEIKRYKNL